MPQVLVPQKLFILRSQFSFFPSNAVSLATSTPILDAAGRMVLFKVRMLFMLFPLLGHIDQISAQLAYVVGTEHVQITAIFRI